MSTNITAKMVNELREMTGAGMMDCKRALSETQGNVEEAITLLRKKGAASAAKRADRAANQGLIESHIKDGKTGVMVEVNCETDFVARNEEFQNFVKEICAYAAEVDANCLDANGHGLMEDLLAQPIAKGKSKTFKELITEKIAKTGENMQFRRFARYELSDTQAGILESYIHMGGKVGVLVELTCENATVATNAELKSFAKDLCLHIAAANPICVTRDSVPADLVAAEREIAEAQAAGKPPAAIEKIVTGKLNKYFSTVALLDQFFVKDQDKTIKQVLAEAAKKAGGDVQIRRFVRYQLGA